MPFEDHREDLDDLAQLDEIQQIRFIERRRKQHAERMERAYGDNGYNNCWSEDNMSEA